MATAATLRGKLFRETSRRYEDRVRIIARVGEGFVDLVEQNRERTEEAYRRVERLLTPMIEAGADRIVLGCTHYPFLSEAMHRVIGDRDVRLVNPAAAVEQRTETLLCEGGIEASGGSRPVYEFMTSADEAYRQRLVAKSEEARTMRFSRRGVSAAETVRRGGGRTAVQGRFLFWGKGPCSDFGGLPNAGRTARGRG
ncbi:MAG: glutamate racemase [Alistipes ihumii]